MITEGTVFSRDDVKYKTEQDLSNEAEKAKEIFHNAIMLEENTEINIR